MCLTHFSVLALSAVASAAPPFTSGATATRCVVFVLPPGAWADLAPPLRTELEALVSQGAGGSMSCAVARPMSEAGAWVTLGAGNRAVWPRGVSLSDALSAEARPRLAQALHEANRTLPYPIDIGSLADTLHRAGLRTAAIGVQAPWQVAPALDSAGRVDFVAPDLSPAGLKQALAVAQFLVVNGAARDDASRAVVVRELAQSLTPQDLLLVVGLIPKEVPYVGLTPVVLRGPGFRGSLTSATTRRVGLIANIDLPPTILHHFGLPLPASYDNGALVRSMAEPFRLAGAIWFDAKSRQADALRPLALPIFFGALLLLLPAALRSDSPRRRGFYGRAMLALMCLPAASYVTVALPVAWPRLALVAAIVAVAVVVGALAGALRPARAVALVSGLTLALLTIDMVTGSRLQPVSLVGYTPGLGGRFYGIGNEVCGLFIAAAALVVGLSRAEKGVRHIFRSPKMCQTHFPPVLLLIATTVAMGHPALAANAGCLLVAVICFAALWAGGRQGRRGWLIALVVCLVGVAVLLGLAAIDATRGPEKMTHIGHAWVRLTSEGGSYLAEFARRRLASAWGGLTETPVSLVAGVWVLFWTVALLKPLGFVRRACEGLPGARLTFAAIALSGFASAFLEDSTVAIPMMMLSLALPVLGLAKQEAPANAENP